MPEHAFEILIGIYVLWIGGIFLSFFLMLTDRVAADPVTTGMLWGSNGIALLFVLYAIADAAGAF